MREKYEMISSYKMSEEQKNYQIDSTTTFFRLSYGLKQMRFSSIVLNLFERSANMKAALDEEYMSNSFVYRWRMTKEDIDWAGIVHCNTQQCYKFAESSILQKICWIFSQLMQIQHM